MKLKAILLSEIDPPATPIRGAIEEEKINELAQSLNDRGLLQPITVCPTGERYMVVYGHRRYLAARQLGWGLIDCNVKDVEVIDLPLLMAAENLEREDLTPVDESDLVVRLHEIYKWEPKEIATKLNRKLPWVFDRFDISTYPEHWRKALAAHEIPLGVCQVFFKIEDEDYREYYFERARLGGCTVKLAREWADSFRREVAPQPNEETADPQGPASFLPEMSTLRCGVCGENHPVGDLRSFHACKQCTFALMRFQDTLVTPPPTPDTSQEEEPV